MRLKASALALCLAGTFLGLLLVTQWRLHTSMNKDVIGMRSEELAAYRKALEAEVTGLRAEAADLRASLASLVEERRGELGLSEELTSLQAFLGLLPVRGSGITAVIEVSQKGKSGEQLPAATIQAEDLLRIINELKASGAEALSINGQRYVNSTTVSVSGNSLTVNNVPSSMPVVIHVVGDPAILESGLRMRGGVLDSIAFWGISASIKREDDLLIPAYSGAFQHKLAKSIRPVKGR